MHGPTDELSDVKAHSSLVEMTVLTVSVCVLTMVTTRRMDPACTDLLMNSQT